MRKITQLFVILILLGILAGCGGSAAEPPAGSETAVLEPTQEIAEKEAVETAVPEPTEVAEEATPTVVPTDEPEPTEEPTAGPTEEPTAVWPDPTATVDPDIPVAPQPPEGSVVQPPYIENSCGPEQTPSDYPCADDAEGWEERIQVPPGFQVKYYAHFDVNEQGAPTSLAFGPDGLLYVALQNLTGGNGAIYKVDNEGDVKPYAGGLNTPTGIAFHPITGELYVSHIISPENEGGESAVSIVNKGRIIEGLPCCYAFMHFSHGIIFDEEGYGYVGVGARADHGEVLGTNEQDVMQDNEAVILKFNPDGSEVEVYAKGLRNPYDIAWDAEGNIWATDNAPDFGPPEELHKVVPGAEHGYPWYDCDVCFSPPAGVEVLEPEFEFMPHASPTGIIGYHANAFPGYYDSLFLTFWSSFPGAQSVVRVSPDGTAADFSLGYTAPIDVTVGPDGNLYVADYWVGNIFQISYIGEE
jgi:glucose/arabinose dehydrogenase